MSEEFVKRMSLFGFELPAEGGEDPEEAEKTKRVLEQVYNQYEQTKDIVWCCLDGGEGIERLPAADAFQAVTSEVHGLLVQCAQLHRLAADRGRRLADSLARERQLRVNAENRAAQRGPDAEQERRLRELREQCDREVAEADERARNDARAAAAAAQRLAAAEKELLVLRALHAAPSRHTWSENHASLGSGDIVQNKVGVVQSQSRGGLSGFQVGNVADLVFGAPGAVGAAGAAAVASGVPGAAPTFCTACGAAQGPEGPDGDLLTRRTVFRRDMLESAVKRLTGERDELQQEIISYAQIVELAKARLQQGGLDAVELERLLAAAEGRRGRVEAEKAGKELEALRAELERAVAERDAAERRWRDEKAQLKKDWQAIYNQVCTELQIRIARAD